MRTPAHMKTEERPGATLHRHLTLVTIGGCLAMVYAACVESSYKTKLFENLGATDFQFGLLMGLPVVALALQFVGAYLQMSGHVERRKPFFMLMLIGCRLLFLPIALLPILMPDAPGTVWVLPFIMLITISGGMNQLATPMWLSWIGDIVPQRVLSRYWAERQRYMQLVWTAAFLAVAVFAMYFEAIPVRHAFALLVVVGLVAGVADIVLFIWVREPPPARASSVGLLPMLTEPFRDRDYRRVITLSTVFSFATWLGGGFMLVFTLKELHVPVWKANVMWCMIGIGGAMAARTWGRLIDKHGQRPVMLTVILSKPWVALAFVFATPENAFWLISIVLFLDSMANCGYVIAMNGFMLKTTPPGTRAMFVAATQAINGIAGGLGAILGGVYLDWIGSMKFEFAGRELGNYHLLFFISFSLRLICVKLAARIREPASSPTGEVLGELLDQWPPRLLTYPYTLYRRLLPGGAGEGRNGKPG
jgi:MFS family permease